MNKTVDSTLFSNAVLELLEETFEQVRGIYLDGGTSLFETLAGISAAEASIQVGGKCATLAAQVTHVTFYLDLALDYVRTQEAVAVDWGEIWRTVEAVNADEWAAIQQALRQSYQDLVSLVRRTEDWGTEGAMGGTMALVVHTAYHLGEIRQALCTLK
jgi:lysozyme family protein